MAARKKAAAKRGAKKSAAKKATPKPKPEAKPEPKPKPAPAKPTTASTGEVLADLGQIAKQIRFYERKLEGQQAAVKETKERLAQLRAKLVDEAQEFGGGQTALPLTGGTSSSSSAPAPTVASDAPVVPEDPPNVDRVRATVDGKEVELVKLEGKWNGNIDGKPHAVNVGTLAAVKAAIENELGKPVTWSDAPAPAEDKPKPKRTRRKRKA